MMMMPSIYRDRFSEDFFGGFFPKVEKAFAEKNVLGLMKTDIKESDESYDLAIDLPGCRKEDVKAHIQDGYLVVKATRGGKSEEKDEAGKVIRRERYSGAMSRSFYIGDQICEEGITARFTDGVLSLSVPKKQPEPEAEPQYIPIEG